MTYYLVAAATLDADQTRTLRSIYEHGYAAGESASWTDVSAPRPGIYDVLAMMRADLPVGFATASALPDSERLVLRHLVIDGQRRGHGLGGRLWQCLNDLASGRGFNQLVWDVGSLDEKAGPPPEYDARLIRIGFFERIGGALLPVGEYESANGGVTQQIPIRLLATSLNGAATIETDPWALRRIALEVCAEHYESNRDAGHPGSALDRTDR